MHVIIFKSDFKLKYYRLPRNACEAPTILILSNCLGMNVKHRHIDIVIPSSLFVCFIAALSNITAPFDGL